MLVSDVARGGDDQMIRREPIAKALVQVLAIELTDGFRSAKNRATERMLGPEATRENVVEKILGIVHVHLDFFEDDLAFFPDVAGIELGTKNEVGDNVEGDGQMLVEDFGVEANLLLRGERIEHAADRVHFAGDSFGGAALGTLENHVLDEMGEAVFFRNFAAGAVADPDADGDGAHVGHGLGDDHEAVAENVFLDVPSFRGSCHNLL